MKLDQYWISDVFYNTKDIQLKLINLETAQDYKINLENKSQLEAFISGLNKKDIAFVQQLRFLHFG